MQEHELPTWNGIVDQVLTELDHGRNGLSEASSWLRSDWQPLGSPISPAAADARSRVFTLIGEAKGLIDEAKDAMYEARMETGTPGATS